MVECVMSAEDCALVAKPESVGFIQVMNRVNSIYNSIQI